MKQAIVDEEGNPIDESQLAPITRMFLTALRTYGAYLVDNSGGFIFYAEDIHSADLKLSDDALNQLIRQPVGTPIPQDKTKWQTAMEKLNQDLEQIPIGFGPWQEGQDPTTAEISIWNFEVVTPFQQAKKLYFAQFGNGQGFTSNVVLTNPSAINSVSGKVDFSDDDGLPLAVGFAAGGNDSAFLQLETLPSQATSSVDFSIPPLGAVTISTDGQGDVAVGSALVSADNDLGGVIRFSIPGIGIAGVGASPPMSGFIAPVRRKSGGINTGIAVHNTESQAVTLDLELRNLQGVEIANATIENLPASGHVAKFIHELFPDADTDDFVGTLVVEVNGGNVAAVALELGSKAGQFTTLSVTPLQ